MQFKKAVKYEARGRVALVGPAGSGKSYTMLTLATLLANGKRIAAIDTEHGSLSKYADQFEFDVIELDSYSPDAFVAALHAAEAGGYGVFCCDSLSHFWMGKDGALEFVDVLRKRSASRDDMAGWKEFRPHERNMVDLMIASPLHVICTMRTKNEYVAVEKTYNGKTKTVREKVGLAPVQREGLEYEFDLVLTMNDENEAIVEKTRCSSYSGKVMARPGAKDFAVFAEWLKGAPPLEPVRDGIVKGTAEDQKQVAAAKLAELRAQPAPPPAAPDPYALVTTATLRTMHDEFVKADKFKRRNLLKALAAKIGGDPPYREILKTFGGALKSTELEDSSDHVKFYDALLEVYQGYAAVQSVIHALHPQTATDIVKEMVGESKTWMCDKETARSLYKALASAKKAQDNAREESNAS